MDSSEDNRESDRFVALHSRFENKGQLFKDLIKVAGVKKMQEHNNKLYGVFDSLQLDDDVKTAWNLSWNNFTQGKVAVNTLKEDLKLNDKDKIHTLIRCAHFIRFPQSNDSELTDNQILANLTGSATGDTKLGDPQIRWAANVVQQGFHAPYQRHDLIVTPTLKTLTEYAAQWNPNKHKAPYTSIIGPTMAGKTRLLMELAKYVPVVYICLRPLHSTGQPPRSGLASEFLPSESNRDMNKYYLCLLAAIFKTVTAFFKMQTKSSALNNQLTAWFDYSFQVDDTPKAEFDTSVQNEMQKIQNDHQTCKPEDHQKLISFLSKAAKEMSSSIPLRRGKSLKLLLAIDEARNLLVPKDQIKKNSYFRLLRQALAFVPEQQGLFSVFTDTSSQVANFSPSLDRDPSLRLPNQGHKLFAPLYKISTFDLNIPPAPSSWDELLSPRRLSRYGCPFYGLYLENASQVEEHPDVGTITTIATAKLMCRAEVPTPQDLSDSHCFALLGSVIQTRLSLHSPINSELVSSHAAHCLFIDQSREMIISDYPPQFVYASAANNLLASHDAYWTKCLNILASAVQQGLVALGDAGEMATRIVLIRAMQKSIAPHETHPDLVPFGYPVRLKDFLQTLSGKNPHTLRFSCTDEKFKERLLNDGWIFFNHFGRIGYTPDATDLMEFLYRGLAVQCKRGQKGLDDLFTIYLHPESASLHPESASLHPESASLPSGELNSKNVSFCGVQTKSQSDSVDWKNSYKWSKSYADIKGIDNPYLILLFSLKRTTARTPEWRKPTDSSDRLRVAYQFCGLQEIKCLTAEMRLALERLIAVEPEDLLMVHEVRDKITKDWVHQVNPMFYERKDRYVCKQANSQAPKRRTSPAPVPPQQSSRRLRKSG